MPDWLAAIILGVVEGATEFIPVSSTGHLLLTEQLLGLSGPFWNAFTVMIQLGAILSVIVVYFQRLITQVIRLPTDPKARRFALSIIVAFLPAGVIGALFHHEIEKNFANPTLICITLIVGGVVLLFIDRWTTRERHRDAMDLPLLTSLGVGLLQCVAMIPGVSRSGATIMGGLAMGLDRRAAAEFSFFLAIPTLVGAFVLDFWESRAVISQPGAPMTIAIGFVVSFVVGLAVVRGLIGFVSRRGFAPFGWWRIVVGIAGLAILHFT